MVTPEMINSVTNVSIFAAPLTDHCVIGITLKPDSSPKCRENYWKFNADLLNLEDYVKEVKALLLEIKNDTEMDTYCRKWEFF